MVVEANSAAIATLGTSNTRRNVRRVICTSIFGCGTKQLSLARDANAR
jgi:hypothetical protein